MLCVKETVRMYKGHGKDQGPANANHGVGALKRFGWTVNEPPKRVELAKGKVVWEVRAVRGLTMLLRLYDAYMAVRRIVMGEKLAKDKTA